LTCIEILDPSVGLRHSHPRADGVDPAFHEPKRGHFVPIDAKLQSRYCINPE